MSGQNNKMKPRRAPSWADVSRLSWIDALMLLWIERKAVLVVGAVICALGLAVALAAPKTYVARAELLVRLGQEYVYQPSVGAGAGAGAAPDMQAVVNAEVRLLQSGEVARRAIAEIGADRLYPGLPAGGDERHMQAAERAFAQSLSIETAPQTPSIALSFKHKDPVIAARALNALVGVYLDYRRDVLVGGASDVLIRQSEEVDARVEAANEALSAFLVEHEIGDFPSELTALAARAGDIDARLLEAGAARQEAEARASALRARYNAEPEEINLFSESDARRQLVELQVEREAALSRYQDDAPPIRELDRRIAQLELFLEGGDPPSVTRRGANPVRQDIASQLFAMEAEARAQRGREQALTAQRDDVRARLRLLQQLEPQFRQLLRERTILEENAQGLVARAEEARSFAQILGGGAEAISIMQRAIPPAQGQSLRMPIALATFVLAAIVASAIGFARGLMRRGLPTPQAAARMLDTPLLAVTAAPPVQKPANSNSKRARPRRAGAKA